MTYKLFVITTTQNSQLAAVPAFPAVSTCFADFETREDAEYAVVQLARVSLVVRLYPAPSKLT
jgi:hypothetical protein